MTVQELETLGVYVKDEDNVERYNNLSEEQKVEATFHVSIIRDDYGDTYVDEAFGLPDGKTPEEAIKYTKGCIINEVEYKAELVVTFPALVGYSYETISLGTVTIGE